MSVNKILSFLPLIVLILLIIQARVVTLLDKSSFKGYLRKSFLSNYIPFAGIFYFLGHSFFSKQVADSIGWPANNPFQKEVAVANLTFAIGAFYVLTMTYNPAADKTIIFTYMTWLIGTLFVHAHDFVKNKNKSFNNVVAAPLTSLTAVIVAAYLLTD